MENAVRVSAFKLLLAGLAAVSLSHPLLAAGLTLTPTGVSDGFALTTFATINPGATGNTGVYGVAVTSSGQVIVNNYVNDTRYLFPDVDGQTVGSAVSAITPSTSQAGAFARAGGQAYGPVNVQFVQFNANGTVNHVLTGVTQTPYFGMWGNPVNGHILATTGQSQLIDINPAGNGGTGSASVVATVSGLNWDGVTVSPDGTTVFVELNQHVIGYNIASGAQVYDSGPLTGQPDGIAMISSTNALNGKLIVNFNGATLNSGFVALLDPTNNSLTTIASGGSRGDYVSADPNGTVLLSYSDVVYRLSCGANCALGQLVPGIPTTPAPSSLVLLLTGLGFAAGLYRIARNPSRL